MIRIDLFHDIVGAHRRRPRCDDVEPLLQIWEVGDLLMLPFVQHRPRIARHIRDGIFAGQERAIGQATVHHAVEAVHLVAIAVHRVRDLVGCVIAEMVVLPGHRTKPAHLPEQPLHDVGAGARFFRKKLPGLFGEIDQHGAGLEHRDRLAAAWRIVIDHRRDTVVRGDGEEVLLELFALADVDREDLVGRAGLFKKHRHFMAVRRGPVMQINHQHVPSGSVTEPTL